MYLKRTGYWLLIQTVLFRIPSCFRPSIRTFVSMNFSSMVECEMFGNFIEFLCVAMNCNSEWNNFSGHFSYSVYIKVYAFLVENWNNIIIIQLCLYVWMKNGEFVICCSMPEYLVFVFRVTCVRYNIVLRFMWRWVFIKVMNAERVFEQFTSLYLYFG